MLDGNTAALRRYEQEQDRQDMAQAAMEERVRPLITEMGKLMVEAMAQANYDDRYDFELEVYQMIYDELEITL